MLSCLTLLFVAWQLTFFYTHYRVSDLLDSLVNTALTHAFLSPVVSIPIIKFILIQLLAYLLWIAWIVFVALSFSEYMGWREVVGYCFGIAYWFFACVFLMLLNLYYYPNSFFAALLGINFRMPLGIILIAMSTFGAASFLIALYHGFQSKRFLFSRMALIFFVLANIIMLLDDTIGYRNDAIHSLNNKPNVIIIGLDSLRPDFTGYAGVRAIKTPHIDQFLAEGTTFMRNFTPLARTFPSWISILTGKYPKHSNARTNLTDPSLVTSQDTLAKRLKQLGYQTIYATDETRFSNITKDYGFDELIGPHMGINDFVLGSLSDFPLTNLLINLPIGKFLFPYNFGNRAAAITYEPNSFLQLLEDRLPKQSGKSLFFSVHFCITHWPFTYAGHAQQKNLSSSEQYKASVMMVDRMLGQLLLQLKRKGWLEHSIVILLSDHGTTLGLPHDRLLEEQYYRGDDQLKKFVAKYKLSNQSPHAQDFRQDYVLNTSYGQGTDVLSLKQYHTILSFKGYGISLPKKQIYDRTLLIDVAPTVLDLLHLSALQHADGMSLKPYFINQAYSYPRVFFIETADKAAEMETDKIDAEKVMMKLMHFYHVNKSTGLLFVDPAFIPDMIKGKQRAVIMGDWLLAEYPAASYLHLAQSESKQLSLESALRPPYYILMNLKTKEWTIGFSSALAKQAPLSMLLQQLRMFYGEEGRGHSSGLS
ncbi:MAG: hypothetical protein A3F12_01890 [Gammaproteobacteria bacterium RIFCSPHIGHO2_12_FULL_38_14]|nr:MAG: hypothetical protein A3F12_01890 [Gammaproteobacteria bacterium RIFCSPHIGHO2_12_FULL_38_14]